MNRLRKNTTISPNICKVEIPVSEVLSNFATQICESLKVADKQESDIS